MANFNWICPYCNFAQVVVDAKSDRQEHHIYVDGLAEGSFSYQLSAIGCANAQCRKLTVSAGIYPDSSRPNGGYFIPFKAQPIFNKRVKPAGGAKPQPDFIPAALREDYIEACLIREDSPKAAATLARRCLQGMIRDFCGISKATLDLEIKELRKMVEAGTAPRGVSIESVEAINHVRGVGNIGAHMERDINLIIPVDPEEAQALIDLIELLFQEWYVGRESRRAMLKRISTIADEKKQAILEGKQLQLAPPEAEATD